MLVLLACCEKQRHASPSGFPTPEQCRQEARERGLDPHARRVLGRWDRGVAVVSMAVTVVVVVVVEREEEDFWLLRALVPGDHVPAVEVAAADDVADDAAAVAAAATARISRGSVACRFLRGIGPDFQVNGLDGEITHRRVWWVVVSRGPCAVCRVFVFVWSSLQFWRRFCFGDILRVGVP